MIRILVAAAACLALAGCTSPKREIGQRAQRVHQLAVSSEARAKSLEILATEPAAKAEAKAIQQEQAEIIENTAEVQDLLHDVQDKPGFFGRLAYLMKLGWWTLILALIVIVIWQTAAWRLIRPTMAALGLIPSAVVSAAKVAGEAFDASPDNRELDKLVTTLRTSDPVFNRAYTREKKKRERVQRPRTA